MRRAIGAAFLGFAMLLTQPQVTEAKTQGIAKHYDPGVMERVAVRRGLPAFAGLASVPDCTKVGWWVHYTINGVSGAALVVDCSDPTPKRHWDPVKRRWYWESDQARHIREGLVIEVNYRTKLALFQPGYHRAAATVWGFTKSKYRPRPVR